MRFWALCVPVMLLAACLAPAGGLDDGLVTGAGSGGTGGLGGGAAGGSGGAGGGSAGAGGSAGSGGGTAGAGGGTGGGVTLPSCLGTSLAMTLQGQTPYAQVPVGPSPGVSGSFLVDFASTSSWIDAAGFSTPPTTSGCTPSTCTYAQFDFFGPWGTVTLNTADFSWLGLTPPQAGIVGTDFLSVFPVTVDYSGRRFLAAPTGGFCSDAQLAQAGLVKLSSTGFFAANVGQLQPMASVLDGGAGHVPNVPTVPVRLAGVTALAQLDTGFDDRLVPHSLNINVAFFDALTAAAPTALVRDAAHDLSLSTCVGVSEPVQAYRLDAGVALELISASGQPARSDPSAVIFVKRTPAAARVCGGIGTWSVPAAQLAGSTLVAAGAVVFDPLHGAVWLPAP